jgi:squalene synthase HpnC
VTASAGAVETPSGKGAGDENFPVGSFLIARPLRPHVAAYYAFARAIDDIADNPELAPEEKLVRLDAMDRGLCEDTSDPELAKAAALRRSLLATGVDFAHARDLVSAFRQDAVKGRYDDWADLMGYCDRSAAPVGRFLLELHGEDRRHFTFSDALCNALQVINHLQDCADDYGNLDRVYLPLQWLTQEGETVEALARPHASRGLRRVLDRCLAHTGQLMTEADRLPGVLKSRRLAMESAIIVAIAHKLIAELARRDPLAERVELTRMQFLACGVRGVAGGLFNRRVRASKAR